MSSPYCLGHFILSSSYLDALALAFVWVFISPTVIAFMRSLILREIPISCSSVIVNSAAFFALDAHHCNNTTGSRGKEASGWSQEKSAFTNTPFPLSTSVAISCHGFHAHGVQAGLGSTAFIWIF
jgi:hypothetical protein